jgi:hypothetical protein
MSQWFARAKGWFTALFTTGTSWEAPAQLQEPHPTEPVLGSPHNQPWSPPWQPPQCHHADSPHSEARPTEPELDQAFTRQTPMSREEFLAYLNETFPGMNIDEEKLTEVEKAIGCDISALEGDYAKLSAESEQICPHSHPSHDHTSECAPPTPDQSKPVEQHDCSCSPPV